jgi:hypothetical protein
VKRLRNSRALLTRVKEDEGAWSPRSLETESTGGKEGTVVKKNDGSRIAS